MKKNHIIKVIFLLYAVLLFLISWVSYRNYGSVTYTYKMENEKRKSDYRFFQYVPGTRVKVDCKGAEKSPSITTEKLEHGTVVMIEGYDLGGETPVQEITLTYYVDPQGFQIEMPSMEAYQDWMMEYQAFRPPLPPDRMYSGNRAFIDMEEVDVEYRSRNENVVRAILGVVFGLLTLLFGLGRRKMAWTESGRYAAHFLEERKLQSDVECWEEQQRSSEEYFERYVWVQEKNHLVYWIALFTVVIVFGPLGMERPVFYTVMAVYAIALVIWHRNLTRKNFKELSDILTEQGQPQMVIMTLVRCYGSRQMLAMRLKSNYAYQSLISLGIYYEGAFHQALEHLELVWDELPRYLKKSVHQIHYHTVRWQCFQMLEDEAGAEAEQRSIEAYLQKHPRQESSVYAKRYRKQAGDA